MTERPTRRDALKVGSSTAAALMAWMSMSEFRPRRRRGGRGTRPLPGHAAHAPEPARLGDARGMADAAGSGLQRAALRGPRVRPRLAPAGGRRPGRAPPDLHDGGAEGPTPKGRADDAGVLGERVLQGVHERRVQQPMDRHAARAPAEGVRDRAGNDRGRVPRPGPAEGDPAPEDQARVDDRGPFRPQHVARGRAEPGPVAGLRAQRRADRAPQRRPAAADRPGLVRGREREMAGPHRVPRPALHGAVHGHGIT